MVGYFIVLFSSLAISERATTDPLMDKMFNHSADYTIDMKSPRLIKSHLPFAVLPPKMLDTAKVIYVARNPWDCCASYWNHVKNFLTTFWGPFYNFEGEYEDFVEMFKTETFEYGSYWNHLKVSF